MKKEKKVPVMAYERNRRGFPVRKICAACQHVDVTDQGCHFCQLHERIVKWKFCCLSWSMGKVQESAGDLRGKVKRPEYIMFLTTVRISESEAMEQGRMLPEEAASVESIRRQFTEITGMDPYWDSPPLIPPRGEE